MRAAVLGSGLALVAAACTSGPAIPPADLALLGSGVGFDFSDRDAFRLRADGSILEIVEPSSYTPPHRSPLALALVDASEYRSFVLDAELMQTGREYGHRDLCLVFGFESAERYYYVHLATTPDENAHNVFLVDRAARRNLLPAQESGVDWGRDEWHRVRLVRDVDDGLIEVYFDDMSAPVLAAVDSTIAWGRVGFGSFDDTGAFRNLVLSRYESRPIERSTSPFETASPAESSSSSSPPLSEP